MVESIILLVPRCKEDQSAVQGYNYQVGSYNPAATFGLAVLPRSH